MKLLRVKEGMRLRRQKYSLAEVLTWLTLKMQATQVSHNLAQSGRP